MNQIGPPASRWQNVQTGWIHNPIRTELELAAPKTEGPRKGPSVKESV